MVVRDTRKRLPIQMVWMMNIESSNEKSTDQRNNYHQKRSAQSVGQTWCINLSKDTDTQTTISSAPSVVGWKE